MLSILNETLNLIAVFIGIISIFILFPFKKLLIWQYIIIIHFVIISLLDIFTFYVYKVQNQNSFWLTPIYVPNVFLGVGLFCYFANPNGFYKKIFKSQIIILGTLLLIKMLFYTTYIAYDEWVWLLLQIFCIIFCLTYLYFLFNYNKKAIFRNPHSFIVIGFLLAMVTPLFSNFLQFYLLEISKDYFTYSLLILNIAAIIAYLLIIRGLLLSKPSSHQTHL